MLAALLLLASADRSISLESLDLTGIEQGWGTPQKNKSVEGNALKIGGQTFTSGLGTHASSVVRVRLGGNGLRLRGKAGIDDEVLGSEGKAVFRIQLDGKQAWSSGPMTPGMKAARFDLDIRRAKEARLVVEDGGNGIDFDHADWVETEFIVKEGAKIATIKPPVERAIILTPKPGPRPKLTGAKIFGARPGRPFLFTVTATGRRPLTFRTTGLPLGLRLDAANGQITGRVDSPGTYRVTVSATNALGSDKRMQRIVVGDKIALTPPLGWNSWNCWGVNVSQDLVRRSARAMVASGLRDHGWTYINIDDGWQGVRGGQYGAIMPNKKFPDMGKLVDEIHGLGLKAGIYSTPWRGSYAGHIGGSADNAEGTYDWMRLTNEFNRLARKDAPNSPSNYTFGRFSFAKQDVRQWTDWGFDYLKYDWNPLDVPHVREMTDALASGGRDIVYSLSNSADLALAADYAKLSNLWRTTGDIFDTWGSVTGIWGTQDRWTQYAGPGRWNDPDMLVVGKLGWGGPLRSTRLTPNEQYSHISLWSLLAAPLLLGCDLEQLDPFTLGLLTNDEVLAVNQDPLGKPATRLGNSGPTEVWVKDMEDGSHAVGLFNKGEDATTVRVDWRSLGVGGRQKVRDLWRQKELGAYAGGFQARVPRHGVLLIGVRR